MRPLFDDRLHSPIVTTVAAIMGEVATVTTVGATVGPIVPRLSSSQSAFQPPDYSMEPPKRYEFVTAPEDGKSRPEKFTSLIVMWTF